MSDFVAGFASRHNVDPVALGMAMARLAPDFTPSPIAQTGDRSHQPQPRSFSPETPGPKHFRPANRDHNPTEGWDVFDANQPIETPAPTIDEQIAAARAEGYADGLAAAQVIGADASARDRAFLAELTSALGQGGIDRDALAERLRQTVLHLVERLIGDVGITPELLTRRVEAAVDLLADASESALLHLNPEDLPLVDGKLPTTVFAVADPNVARGSFVMETKSTIVEDGPANWLAQLSDAVERVPLPVAVAC